VRRTAPDNGRHAYNVIFTIKRNPVLSSIGANIMSKSQDSKKAVKKEPAKTPKEKKEAKKVKKEASKRQ
jgi:hypothetical protein